MNFILKTLFICLVITGCMTAPEREASDHHGVNTALMDTTVSPRTDFYRFVNGRWLDSVDIPADRGRWGSFDELRIATSKNTLAVLESAVMNGEPDADTDQGKAALFYGVAMDTAALDAMKLDPILPLLTEIKSIKTLENVSSFLSTHFKINGSPYFNLAVRSGFDVSDTNSLFVFPGALGLPERDYYLNSDSVTRNIQKEYRSLLEQVFDRLEVSPDAESVAKEVFQLEKSMAEIQLTKVQRRNTELLNNPMSVHSVDDQMNFIKLDQFLEAQDIDQVDTLIVTQPDYMTGLDKVLNAADITTHKAYLAWTVYRTYGNYLDTNTEDLLFSFYGKVLEGTDVKKPRWERVLNTANSAIGEAIGQLYVDEYFPPEAKAEALRLVDNVKKAFGQRIRNLNWMTDTTKQKALEKLATFTVKIGYPDQWKDYSELSLVSIDAGGSYADNMQRIIAWNWEEDVRKIGQEVDKSEWFMAPQVVNAYYNPSYNEIVFPAAILQPPFFDFEADPAVNYGGIGAVIGHEISHGFDDQGSRFDAEGNLKNWWTSRDKEAFDALTGKLAAQYDEYKPFDDLAVNGQFTLGENIGDLGGVNVAYEALMMALENKDVGRIDGFTQPQRFFINWATIWRTKYREEALRKQIKTDPHSPGMYRAVGPIANMDEFYEAFNIQEGDKLYIPAERRIKIW
ncbi:M13 family metallopeptidase [Membranicola marinus]|uniref:M13 family metallopeptidase n=1 Tax=Membranihabitans marinus TaxID=1227546 RepID=A0A953I1B7_9BACT|nr:M13 family metallopeptidase [Membranihabitans marinus]MBY5959477.1 M13 family metallopeptidase [Membranihabitans marinus]